MASLLTSSRKDIKKQSYYVWFLGAKESKGYRGQENVKPVLKYLLDREQDVEPTKVTLQVSNKGLKIIQNICRSGSKTGKTDQIKHLIPQSAVTYVMQEDIPNDDIVCCILLLYNPVTKCPLHVHAYRCDSVETATSLRTQLEQLVEKGLNENQGKFREETTRLVSQPRGGLSSLPHTNNVIANGNSMLNTQQRNSCAGSSQRLTSSDGRSTRTDEEELDEYIMEEKIRDVEDYEHCVKDDVALRSQRSTLERHPSSESDEAQVAPQDPKVAKLYDNLAQELKEKLGNKKTCPLLLPPKDYDTVCRRQGNLRGIDYRRSTHKGLIGIPGSPTPLDEGVEDKKSSSKGTTPSPKITKTSAHSAPKQTTRLTSSSSGKSSSGIGSDEMLNSRSAEEIHDEVTTDSEDEWNYRPANKNDLKQQNRSMDFLEQRLEHFHMGETPPLRTKSPENRYSYIGEPAQPIHHRSSHDLSHRQMSIPHQPQRSLSNHNLLSSMAPCQSLQNMPPTAAPLQKSATAAAIHNGHPKKSSERPISFPMGVTPLRRDIPLAQPLPQYRYHQHPVQETMIEPLSRRPLSPPERAKLEKMSRQQVIAAASAAPLMSMPQTPGTPKSAYFSRRPLSPTTSPSPVAPHHSMDRSMPYKQIERGYYDKRPDQRRQSMAEPSFRYGLSNDVNVHERNPLAKYFVNPLDRRTHERSRYSVAEPHGHRIY